MAFIEFSTTKAAYFIECSALYIDKQNIKVGDCKKLSFKKVRVYNTDKISYKTFYERIGSEKEYLNYIKRDNGSFIYQR